MINNNINVSDDDIIKLLQKRWGCDKFIFDCKIGKHPQKTDVLSYISNVKYRCRICIYLTYSNIVILWYKYGTEYHKRNIIIHSTHLQ